MLRFVLLFVAVVVLLKLALNLSKYVSTKALLKDYQTYVPNPTWEFVEKTPRIVQLFRSAGVEDSKMPHIELVGYGHVSTSNVSVFANLTVTKEGIPAVVTGMFHQALGTYRSRMIDAINPLFWIEFVLTLPRQVLSYLGVPAQSIGSKIAQVVYWIVGGLIGIVYAAYSQEIQHYVRSFVDAHLK